MSKKIRGRLASSVCSGIKKLRISLLICGFLNSISKLQCYEGGAEWIALLKILLRYSSFCNDFSTSFLDAFYFSCFYLHYINSVYITA